MGSETLDGAAIDAVAALARSSVGTLPSVSYGDGRSAVILTDGDGSKHVHDTTPKSWRAPLPNYIEQTLVLTSQQSFIDYVKKFKTDRLRLFAVLADQAKGVGGGEIVAHLDYHGDASTPGAKAHVVTYRLKDSEEWARWAGISADTPTMDQIKFVRFLEENSGDIAEPAGADILELARDFSATRNVKFDSAVRLDNGDQRFDYVSEAQGKSKTGQVSVPNKFKLEIPVFYGEPASEVWAFLRWNVDDGLKLGVKIHRPVYVRTSLFEAIAGNIAEAVGAPVHYAAEAPR